MRINFFDAQLQLAPEYFISSVGLRVTYLGYEHHLPGIINYDELEIQFQQTLSIPNDLFAAKEMVVYVELLAALDDAASKTRRIGLGSLTINREDNERNLIYVPLSSKNLDIIMAQLKVSLTIDQTVTTDCNESDWDRNLSLYPLLTDNHSASTSVTGSNRIPSHFDRENNFSLSFSRVSCLTNGSTHQQSSETEPTSGYEALSNKIHCQLSAIRKECFIEHFDNSLPEIPTTGRYEDPNLHEDTFDTLLKFQLENNFDTNGMAEFTRPLRDKEHNGREKRHNKEYVTALMNDERRNKVVTSSNIRTEEVQQNNSGQKFEGRSDHFGSHVPTLEKKSRKCLGSQVIEEVKREGDVEKLNGGIHFGASATNKYMNCYENISKDGALHESCCDSFISVIPEKSFLEKPANLRSNESYSGTGETSLSRDTGISSVSHIRNLQTAVASESNVSSIHSTRIDMRERHRKVLERASDRFQISGGSSSRRQDTKSAGRSKRNMAVSDTPIHDIIDALGLESRRSYECSRVVDKNKNHVDKGIVRTQSKAACRNSVDGSNINQAVKRILERRDFDTISAQQTRLDSAERRRCEALQATTARAQSMSLKSILKSKAIKEAVLLSCSAFDKLRNDFDRKNAIRNKNQKSAQVRAPCSRNTCYSSARARSEDSRSSSNRVKGGLVDPAGDARRDRTSPTNISNEMRSSRSKTRANSSGGALLPYSDLRRRSRSTSNLLRPQESSVCSYSMAHQRGWERTKEVTDPHGSALSAASFGDVGVVASSIIHHERGRTEDRERETTSIGSERTNRRALRTSPIERDVNDNQIKRVITTILPRQLVINNMQPNDGFKESVQLIRRGRSASQSDRFPNSQVRADKHAKYHDSHKSRRSRSAHSAPVATSLKNLQSSDSQILLVTLVLERIDAIKRNISAATELEAKNMLRMIEKLLSLAMSLTSTDKKRDGVTVKCILQVESPITDSVSAFSNSSNMSSQFEIDEEDPKSETTSLNTVTEELSECSSQSLKSRNSMSLPTFSEEIVQNLLVLVPVPQAEFVEQLESNLGSGLLYRTYRKDKAEEDDEVCIDSDDQEILNIELSNCFQSEGESGVGYPSQNSDIAIVIDEVSARKSDSSKLLKETLKPYPPSSSSSLRGGNLTSIISDDIAQVTSAIGSLQVPHWERSSPTADLIY